MQPKINKYYTAMKILRRKTIYRLTGTSFIFGVVIGSVVTIFFARKMDVPCKFENSPYEEVCIYNSKISIKKGSIGIFLHGNERDIKSVQNTLTSIGKKPLPGIVSQSFFGVRLEDEDVPKNVFFIFYKD